MLSTKKIVCSVPGRICLAGEDLDWTVGPSILCTVNLKMKVTIRATYDGKITVFTNYKKCKVTFCFKELNYFNKEPIDYVISCLKYINNQGIQLKGMYIKVDSEIPVAAGMSSSAALISCTLKALYEFFDMNISKLDLCGKSYYVERYILKRNIGQMDPYACVLGGTIYLESNVRPPKNIKKYNCIKGLDVLIIDTQQTRNTSDIIKLKKKRFEDKEKHIMKYLSITTQVIDEMKIELDKGMNCSNYVIGQLVNIAHEGLVNELQVSTPLIDASVELCNRYGAIGTKITGTGFGGCIFALFPSNFMPLELIKCLNKLGVKCIKTNLEHNGLIVLND